MDIPLLDPSYVSDPRPFWQRLRDEAPVLRSEAFGFWVVSRYDDVLAVVRNHEDFSSAIGPAGGLSAEAQERNDAGAGVGFLPMIQNDPPDHGRLRSVLSRAFSPRRVAAMEPRIGELARDLAAGVRRRHAEGRDVDLYRDFASPLPVIVIAELLGVPESDRERLSFWAGATGVGSGGKYSMDVRAKVVEEIDACLEGLIAERRRSPSEDLVSALVQISHDDGQKVRDDELLGFCKLLWIAGNETTTNLITNTAVLLDRRPELRRACGSPSLLPGFVEEALRCETPVSGLFRRATRDVELGGQKIGEGDPVWILFGSANRDPRHFDDPERFDPGRKPNDHLALGFGIHFCLGAALARLEARVAFEALAPLLDEFALEPESGERIPTPILRGWLKLPMHARGGTR